MKTSVPRARKASRPSDEACIQADAALVRAFDLLGKRWTGVILGTLKAAPAGFRALARAVDGISDSMLSDRLGELCDAGLVSRTVSEGPPLAVTYALTLAGRALLPALEQITRWAEKYLPRVGEAGGRGPADPGRGPSDHDDLGSVFSPSSPPGPS